MQVSIDFSIVFRENFRVANCLKGEGGGRAQARARARTQTRGLCKMILRSKLKLGNWALLQNCLNVKFKGGNT